MTQTSLYRCDRTQTKWPSTDFDEVSTEKVVTNVELNAEGNSRESGNALA